jgi:hypothetical protein
MVLMPSWLSIGLSALPTLPLLWLLFLWTTGPAGDHLGTAFVVFFAVLASANIAVLVAAFARRRVILGPGALRHRNLGRWRTIAAPDIQAITLHDGGLTAALQIWTTDRHPHTCAALTAKDINVVGDWWLAHRGSAWRPTWEASAMAPSTAQSPSATPQQG